MIKSDNEIRDDWKTLEEDSLNEICEKVKSYERNIQDYLAEVIAALCELDLNDMMTKADRVHCNHARWLFWYAYRHMTNDTFEHMSQITDRYGRKFAHQSINSAVNKMSSLIADNTIWTKRWLFVRRVIKARDQSTEIDFDYAAKTPTDRVTITIPQELKSKIEINYI